MKALALILALVSLAALAQHATYRDTPWMAQVATPPVSGNSYNPYTRPNLEWVFRADSMKGASNTSGANGVAINYWWSTQGLIPVLCTNNQASTAWWPVWSSGNCNGHPSLGFNGTEFLTNGVSNLLTTVSQDWTAFILYRETTVNAQACSFGANIAAGGFENDYVISYNTALNGEVPYIDTNGGPILTNGPQPDTGWHFMMIYANSASLQIQWSKNGGGISNYGNVASSAGAGANNVAFGGEMHTGPTLNHPFAGDIEEAGLFKGREITNAALFVGILTNRLSNLLLQ